MRWSPETAAFRIIWAICARRGECDALDGAEYRRVLREWREAHYPYEAADFIRRRANIDAQGNVLPVGRDRQPKNGGHKGGDQ